MFKLGVLRSFSSQHALLDQKQVAAVASDMFSLTDEVFYLSGLLALDTLLLGLLQDVIFGVNLNCYALIFTAFES